MRVKDATRTRSLWLLWVVVAKHEYLPGRRRELNVRAGGVLFLLDAPATLARMLCHDDPVAVDGLFPR